MFCYKCGKQIDDQAKICENCGAIINSQSDSGEPTEQTNETSSNMPVKRKRKKPFFIAIIVIIIVAIIGCAVSVLSDDNNQKDNESKIEGVQNSYFDFLPEMTVGELLYEFYGEDYWIYNSIEYHVEFFGTNKIDKSGISISFANVGENVVSASKVMYHSEDETAHQISNEDFESYILSLYHQLVGNETTIETTVTNEKTTVITTKIAETTTATTTTVDEKSDVSEKYMSYLSLLNLVNSRFSDYDINSFLYYRYYIYDIDHDGTYELLYHVGEGEAVSEILIYSVNEDGEVVDLGEINGGHTWLSEKDGKLYSNFGYHGYYTAKELRIVNQNDALSVVEETVLEQDGLSDYTTYGTAIAGYSISDTSAVEALCPKKSIENKAYVEAYAEVLKYSGYEGAEVHLHVDGDFSYVKVQLVSDYGDTGFSEEIYTKAECSNYITFNFNPPANPPSYFIIVSFNESGVVGDTIACDIPNESSGTIPSGGLAYNVVGDKKGQINCHGGTVAGFTTDYIVNGGAVGKVRSSLGDAWHVTAKNVCINYGITWYELWDSDDGDYYGWVDSNYIDFY